jgi:hypothetical protein
MIQSDGTPWGTKIYDSTGHEIQGNITQITWSIRPDKLAQATVTFEDVHLSAPADLVETAPDPLGR